MTFDPMKDIQFRGKLISDLSPDELRDALVQALTELHRLKATEPAPDASGSYMGTGSAYWNPDLAGR